jgi:hypothetical protein
MERGGNITRNQACGRAEASAKSQAAEDDAKGSDFEVSSGAPKVSSFAKLAALQGGIAMAGARKVIDCRRFPSDRNCTLEISGTEDEVLEIATIHAVQAHGHQNSPELREQLRSLLEDETRTAAA